jgi:hypothetical protein
VRKNVSGAISPQKGSRHFDTYSPEPSTLALGIMAAAGLAVWRRVAKPVVSSDQDA